MIQIKKLFLFFFLPLIGLSQSLTLTWTDNSNNETGFGIERSTDGSAFAQVATVATNVTTYQDTAISYNTTYWYRVYAYNGVGNSGFTNTASGSSPSSGDPPTPPQNLIYSVSFDPIPDPEEFNVSGATYFAVAPSDYSYTTEQTSFYASRKYTALSSAEASLPSNPTSPQIINILGNWTSNDSSRVVFDGSNPTASNYIYVRALDSARHNGISKASSLGKTTSYRLRTTAAGHVITVSDPYVILEGIEIVLAQTGTSDEGIRVAANNVKIDSCIILNETPSSGQDGIHITHENINNLIVINSIIANWYRAGITIQFWNTSSTASSTGSKFINNTIINCGTENNTYAGGITIINNSSSSSIAALIYNNLLYGNYGSGRKDINIIGSNLSIAGSNNLTSDNSASLSPLTNGIINQTLSNINFISYSLGDFHIQSPSSAINAGVNRSIDGFNKDIDNDVRVVWDIGVDESQ